MSSNPSEVVVDSFELFEVIALALALILISQPTRR